MRESIELIELTRYLNKLHDYADVSMFGAYRDGFMKAWSMIVDFKDQYEKKED